MGAAAGRLADVVIITSDNPRSEDPAEICSQIETGLLTVDSPAEHMVVLDRRAAIRTAINMASPDDLVIIAGKGHETYQEFADGRIHFDDGEEVRAAIKELK
jgi:UDP-N-acetylmuramyl tripeptide synthase